MGFMGFQIIDSGGDKLGAGLYYNTFFGTVTHGTASLSSATSTVVVSSNTGRQYFEIWNTNANVVYCALGADAATSTGIFLTATGGSYKLNPQVMWKGEIECMSSGASTISYIEK